MPKDIYVQPDAPDPVLDAELVLSLARRHLPGAKAVTDVDESGGEARTYGIDSDFILKTQRPQQLRPRTSLEKEVFFLNQLASAAPDLSVPRALGYGREGRFIEYTLMTRMAGVALRNANLNGAARLEVMADLGRVLRRIHQLPQAPFLASDLFPGDHSAAHTRARVAELFEEFVVRIHDGQRTWLLPLTPEQVAARALALWPATDERVALHSNPWHEHTFVDPVTGRYIGLIDFGDAYISHPTFDLRRWRTREERAALLAGYTAAAPVSADFMQAWLVAQVMGDMAVVALNPALSPAAHTDLERLAAEL
ncbi:MAG: aminoglycoside phosphotransferase family protein [Chloroflexi bacterium]|nr:aminoglycoside phosphotransferase family protein [Chloroflexota bacterium]